MRWADYNIKAEIYPKCGLSHQIQSSNISAEFTEQGNKWIIYLLLYWFLGVFGIHCFYTGYTSLGVVPLPRYGGWGIWTLINFLIIVSGNFKNAQGNPVINV